MWLPGSISRYLINRRNSVVIVFLCNASFSINEIYRKIFPLLPPPLQYPKISRRWYIIYCQLMPLLKFLIANIETDFLFLFMFSYQQKITNTCMIFRGMLFFSPTQLILEVHVILCRMRCVRQVDFINCNTAIHKLLFLL